MTSSMPPQYRNQYQQQQQQQQQQHQRLQQTPHKRIQQPQAQGHPRPDDRAKLAAQERAEAERAQREKIRAATPTDKTMPEGIEELIIGDGVDQYKKLRDMERKLDAVMMRKRLDLTEPIQSAVKKYTTLRIWISNTVENQPWQGRDLDENAFDFNMGVESTYRVKIEGRTLDDEVEEAPKEKDSDDEDEAEDDSMDVDAPAEKAEKAEKAEEPPQKRTKLSHFFKQITIDFDRNKNLQPDGMTQIEWKKPAQGPAGPDFDCLEFERKSDENINITINLYRDEKQERFVLSKELSELLDLAESEKTTVLKCIGDYIRAMGLPQDEEKRIVQCDERMKAVFHADQIRHADLPRLLDAHLSTPPPLALNYTIRCDPDYASAPIPTIYTLQLQTPSPPSLPSTSIQPPPTYANQILATLSNPTTLSTLKQYDKHTALLIQSLTQAKLKHAFMTGLAADPVGFTKRWMSSQKRDLEMVLVEGGRYEGGDVDGGVPRGSVVMGQWRGGEGGKKWEGREVEEVVKVMVRKDGGAKFRHA